MASYPNEIDTEWPNETYVAIDRCSASMHVGKHTGYAVGCAEIQQASKQRIAILKKEKLV